MPKRTIALVALCVTTLLVGCGGKPASKSEGGGAPSATGTGPVPSPAFLAAAKSAADARLGEVGWMQVPAQLESLFSTEPTVPASSLNGGDWAMWRVGLVRIAGRDGWGETIYGRGPKLTSRAAAVVPITATVSARPAGACRPGDSIQISICPFALGISLAANPQGPFAGVQFPTQEISTTLIFDARDGSWIYGEGDPLATLDLNEPVARALLGDEAATTASQEQFRLAIESAGDTAPPAAATPPAANSLNDSKNR